MEVKYRIVQGQVNKKYYIEYGLTTWFIASWYCYTDVFENYESAEAAMKEKIKRDELDNQKKIIIKKAPLQE